MTERPDEAVDPVDTDGTGGTDGTAPAGEGAEPAPAPAAEAGDVLAPDGGGAHDPDEATGLDEDPEVPESPGDRLVVAERLADERLLDLQRLQAEYLNYKRRVERDRELVKQNAVYSALAPITEVLDNIDRAREHSELEGGFKSVAEQLERTVAAAGLEKFGTAGDAFDPTVHEALSHLGQDPDVQVTTCKVIAKAGYKIGDRVVRAAQVLVVDPVDA